MISDNPPRYFARARRKSDLAPDQRKRCARRPDPPRAYPRGWVRVTPRAARLRGRPLQDARSARGCTARAPCRAGTASAGRRGGTGRRSRGATPPRRRGPGAIPLRLELPLPAGRKRVREPRLHGSEGRHDRQIERGKGFGGWKRHGVEEKLGSVRGLTMRIRSVESDPSMFEGWCTRPRASGRAARGSGGRRAGGAAENPSHDPSRESSGPHRLRTGAEGYEGRNAR